MTPLLASMRRRLFDPPTAPTAPLVPLDEPPLPDNDPAFLAVAEQAGAVQDRLHEIDRRLSQIADTLWDFRAGRRMTAEERRASIVSTGELPQRPEGMSEVAALRREEAQLRQDKADLEAVLPSLQWDSQKAHRAAQARLKSWRSRQPEQVQRRQRLAALKAEYVATLREYAAVYDDCGGLGAVAGIMSLPNEAMTLETYLDVLAFTSI